jgi:GTP-binding protein Era
VKSAVVAVIGRPSSGKSTLVNALCGGKVSIVSPVPQTTRNRVRGILTTERGQIVFIDTPGFHLSEKKFNTYMTDLVSSTVAEADAVLYVVDGTRAAGDEEKALQESLRTTSRPLVVCVNKLDAAGPAWAEAVAAVRIALFAGSVTGAAQGSGSGSPAGPFEISALAGTGIDPLKDALFTLAPDGDQMYPPDYYTDQTPEFRISEIVREQATLLTREEIPHSIYVRIEDLEMQDEGETLWARGFICVERESQKGIVVGRGGEKIRTIVHEAERALNELFPYRIRLDMRVKVDREWRKRDPLLRKMIR